MTVFLASLLPTPQALAKEQSGFLSGLADAYPGAAQVQVLALPVRGRSIRNALACCLMFL